jgi:hypothetical protein
MLSVLGFKSTELIGATPAKLAHLKMGWRGNNVRIIFPNCYTALLNTQPSIPNVFIDSKLPYSTFFRSFSVNKET